MGKLSEEQIQQIPILYKELGTKKAVAEKLSISPTTVARYLKLLAAADNSETELDKEALKENGRLTQKGIDEINRLYKENRNISETARILKLSTSTVRRHLTKENIALTEQQNLDRDALWYYIIRLFGVYTDEEPVSGWNVTQMMRFNKQGMPYRAQLLTLKYFYEVKKNSLDKSKGSIGIIPYVFNDAMLYYSELEKKQKTIGEAILNQLNKDRVEIKYSPSAYFNRRRKKKKKEINLDFLM